MTPTASRKRWRAHIYGLRAESLAALWLMAKGYRILARRYNVKGGELDLVVFKGDAVAFVEVKARDDLDAASISILEMKRRRISRAARVWLMRNPWAMGCTLRGDGVFIAPWRLPRHVVAAYRLDLD